MALSRSASGALQRWAVRAIAAFLVIYMLGAFGVPTFVPYIAVVLAVVVDGVRSFIGSRTSRQPLRPPFNRNETIH
jgi:hypothetical protein